MDNKQNRQGNCLTLGGDTSRGRRDTAEERQGVPGWGVGGGEDQHVQWEVREGRLPDVPTLAVCQANKETLLHLPFSERY